MITLKINVNQIDKKRLYKGEKGTYLNAVLIPTPESEYSDYMVVESVTQDEREAGTRGNILGNAKILQTKSKQDNQVTEDDELPF